MRRASAVPVLSCAAALALLAGAAPAAAAPNVCTFEYRPVCASARGAAQRTFGNACAARAARARILHAGECRPERPTACARIYRPVCARTPAGARATFPNACEARRAGARPVRHGPCPG